MTQPRLLDRVRAEIRTRHYSYLTEQAYVLWISKFIHFNELRHPLQLGESEISAYLSHLAVDRKVSASTQNQALSAILFLYRHVLKRDLAWMDDIVRARRPSRMPTVLSAGEVATLLKQLCGAKWLMASLIYGAGLRLRECARVSADYASLIRPTRT